MPIDINGTASQQASFLSKVPKPNECSVNSAYLTALSALAGSSIGALASFATTWLTQNYQDRSQRKSQATARRERLYGEFVDEASKAFADALVNTLTETSDMVHLYATRSKIRLFAPDEITLAADACIDHIIKAYAAPNHSLAELQTLDWAELDFLRDFTEQCRDDLTD